MPNSHMLENKEVNVSLRNPGVRKIKMIKDLVAQGALNMQYLKVFELPLGVVHKLCGQLEWVGGFMKCPPKSTRVGGWVKEMSTWTRTRSTQKMKIVHSMETSYILCFITQIRSSDVVLGGCAIHNTQTLLFFGIERVFG